MFFSTNLIVGKCTLILTVTDLITYSTLSVLIHNKNSLPIYMKTVDCVWDCGQSVNIELNTYNIYKNKNYFVYNIINN